MPLAGKEHTLGSADVARVPSSRLLLLVSLLCPVPTRILAQTDSSPPSPPPPSYSAVSSGLLQSNSTWAVGGSPYLVQGVVLVPAGVTLSIAAGVTVAFASSSASIVVRGSLVAAGTASAPITFSNEPGVSVSATALSFQAAALSASVLANVQFQSVSTAILLSSTVGSNTGTLTVSDSVFSSTQLNLLDGAAALAITGSTLVATSFQGGVSPVTLTGCALVGGSAINYTPAAAFAFNTCSVNGTYLMYGGGPGLRASQSVFTGVAFSAAYTDWGLSLTGCTVVDSTMSSYQLSASDSTFVQSSSGGSGQTVVWSPASVTLVNSALTRVALSVFQSSTVQSCTFTGSGPGSGSAITSTGGIQLTDSTITQFDTALSCSSSACAASGNNLLCTGSGFALVNTGSFGVTATNNWWGTGDGAAIPGLISDIFDNPTVGQVTFVPFAASAFAASGAVLSAPPPSPPPSPPPPGSG